MIRSTTKRREGDRGAALVELAIVAIPLFTILFGIIEFGWAFGQHLDVRHGAREGARLAAVNYRPAGVAVGDNQRDAIVTELCSRMGDTGDASTTVELTMTATTEGSSAEIHISRSLDTLTGFLDFALGGVNLESTVKIRLEQAATWTETPSGGSACP